LIEGHAATLPKEKGDALLAELDELTVKEDFAGMKKLIDDNKIKCGVSGTANWTDEAIQPDVFNPTGICNRRG
jgi:glycyl-tRNA synthetase